MRGRARARRRPAPSPSCSRWCRHRVAARVTEILADPDHRHRRRAGVRRPGARVGRHGRHDATGRRASPSGSARSVRPSARRRPPTPTRCAAARSPTRTTSSTRDGGGAASSSGPSRPRCVARARRARRCPVASGAVRRRAAGVVPRPARPRRCRRGRRCCWPSRGRAVGSSPVTPRARGRCAGAGRRSWSRGPCRDARRRGALPTTSVVVLAFNTLDTVDAALLADLVLRARRRRRRAAGDLRRHRADDRQAAGRGRASRCRCSPPRGTRRSSPAPRCWSSRARRRPTRRRNRSRRGSGRCARRRPTRTPR